MKDDSDLFRTSSGPKSLPLYEGKMLHQFGTGSRNPSTGSMRRKAERDC